MSAKVYQQLAKDYPVDVLGWIHYAEWMGPLKVPKNHIDMTGSGKRFGRTEADIDHFKQEIQDKGKTKPVILVKTPANKKLFIVDGHARTLAYCDLGEPVRAYIGAVTDEHGDWERMHDNQLGSGASASMEEVLRRMLANGHIPVAVGSGA